MLKIGALSITTVILCTILRKNVPEYSLLLAITFAVLLFIPLKESIESILTSMYYLSELSNIDHNLLVPVIKTVAISIITKITGEFCRSAGESGVAVFVEFSGTVVSLVIALPLIEGVMSMMADML